MRGALPALVLLAACGKADETKTVFDVEQYAPADGRSNEYVLAGSDSVAGDLLMLRVDGDAWTVRQGADWTTGADVGTFSARAGNDGLFVDDRLLLPPKLTVGSKTAGVEVTATGDAEVYYGTFANAVTVEVPDGRWAGTQVFAPSMGPVEVTLDGTAWDLDYYE